MRGSSPAAAPQASMASVSASCAAEGRSLRASASTADAAREALALDGFDIGSGRIGPEQQARRVRHGGAS
jgi:hypothetical protein